MQVVADFLFGPFLGILMVTWVVATLVAMYQQDKKEQLEKKQIHEVAATYQLWLDKWEQQMMNGPHLQREL